MKNENTNTTSAPITMNITTDLAALVAIVKQHGYTVIKNRKVVPTEIDKENGRKIRELRLSMDRMKQKEFAKAIHRNANYVSLIECGKVRVSFRFAQAVYEAFRVYPDIKFPEKEKKVGNIISM